MKAQSVVNLLEELENSAGCPQHASPSSSSVNRVISAALVPVLQQHISLFLHYNGFTGHYTHRYGDLCYFHLASQIFLS